MPTLSQSQIDTLKNKGLSLEKIEAIATQKGYTIPKQSLLKSIGSSLVKSEKRFGQSIAGAIGSTVLSGTRNSIEETNQRNRQVQDNVLARIKEKRAKGEDTTRLMGALKTLDKEVNFYDILNDNTGGSLNKSARQVFGEGLGVATDIIGAGALPGGVGELAKATTFTQGVRQGARAGAIGGSIFGVATGATSAAQENKSAGEIIGGGARGGVQGAVAGAVVGGTIGGISGAISARVQRGTRKELDYTLDLVSPRVTRKVSEEAGKQGRVTAPGAFSKAKILPSSKDIKLADAVGDYVSSRKNVVQNVDSINAGVTEINNGVKGMLLERNVKFEPDALLARYGAAKAESKLIFASDVTAERTYNAVVDEFLKNVKSTDAVNLFNARQSFDQIPAIKKLLQTEGLGENVRRTIVLDVRRVANEFVSSLLPANNPLKYLLQKETRMLEAVGNMVSKNVSTIGKSKINMLLSKNPLLRQILFGVAAGTAFSLFSKAVGNRE